MKRLARCLLLTVGATAFLAVARGQTLYDSPADMVPPRVEAMYREGLDFLSRTQGANGAWQEGYANQPGVVGLAILAYLAHGDDPNFGPYRDQIHRGIDHLIKQQNAQNGYIGNSMYNHGFATLALAEAYGVVDDDRIGPALHQAVKLLLTSQARNALGAWRYSPESNDADTTVSGACIVALFAARNAGIPVPDSSFKKAIDFYRRCQSADGGFGYADNNGSSPPRAAIGVLAIALAKQTDSRFYSDAYRHLLAIDGSDASNYLFYYLYYASQAHFRGEAANWRRWNQSNIEMLSTLQGRDGSWNSSHGVTFGTATALLSLALNYRFLPIYER